MTGDSVPGLSYDIKPIDVLRADIEATATKWPLAPFPPGQT